MTRSMRSLLAALLGLLLVSIVRDRAATDNAASPVYAQELTATASEATQPPSDSTATSPAGDTNPSNAAEATRFTVGKLTLRNGDYLQGRFAPSTDAATIAWRSSIFAEPLLLDLQGLDSVDFENRPAAAEQPPQPTTTTLNPAAGLLRLLQMIPDSAQKANNPAKPVESSDRPRGARVALLGDNVLYGTITAIDGESIRIRSDRHDEVTLQRDAVLEAEGIGERSSLLFDGSSQLQVWRSLGGDGRSTSEWQRAGSGLRTEKKGANLYHETPQVEPWLMEVALSGEGKAPEFQVAMGLGSQLNELPHAVCIDNWGDRLVAYREGEGEIELVQLETPAAVPPQAAESPAAPMPSGTDGDTAEAKKAAHTVQLRIYFSPEQRELTVYSGQQRLGQLQLAPTERPFGKGVLIRNRGSVLRIEKARLRRWNGEFQNEMPQAGSDLVQLVDGRVLQGRIAEYTAATGKLKIEKPADDGGSADEPVEVEWAQVDRLVLAHAARAATSGEANNGAPAANLLVDYLDGEILAGRYAGATDEGMLLEMPQARGVVLTRWAGMRRVQHLSPANPDKAAEEALQRDAHALVESPTHRLHGRMVNSTNAAPLLWQCAYSRKPVQFLGAIGAHVSFEPGPSPIEADEAWGDLTLVSGETIPCRIDSVDEGSLRVTFPGGHTASIPRDQMRAMRLFSPRSWIYTGFRETDPWYASTREAGTIEWQPEQLRFFKPALLAREIPEKTRLSVHFDLQFHGTANTHVVVGIGADEPQHALRRPNDHVASEEAMREAAKQRPDYVVEVIMTRHRSSLTARGVNKAAGVLGMMFEANPFAAEERISPLAMGENNTVHIEIRIDPIARDYAILGNGQEMHRWRDTSPLEGRLLYFGATGEQDAVSRPAQAADNQATRRPLATFHNFRIQRWSGDMRSADRERFLTRRVGASPKAVTHVLRAWNGDSLRGRLVSMTTEQVEFQSRLDTLVIPREKVAEIIQLPPPSPDTTNGGANANGGSDANGSPDAQPTPPEAQPETVAAGSRDESDSTPSTNPGKPAADSGRVVLRRGGSLILHKIQATDQLLQGDCSVAPISIPWAEISEIYFAVTSVPKPPYSDWALRNPPPLPEMPASAGPQEPSPLLGKAAPELKLEMLEGPPFELKALRGRVVILDFWATWCGPCLASMPSLMEIAQDESLRDKVALIAVNQQEEPAELREFLAGQLWKLDVALDRDGEAGKLFGASAIPHTVIIDREGIIRHVHVGATPDLKKELMDKIETLLGPPPVTEPK